MLSIAFVVQITRRVMGVVFEERPELGLRALPQSDNRRIPAAPRLGELSKPISAGAV
jgi:hypothetical protein